MCDYVCSNIDNPTMLQYKVYLDIRFYMGRRGKEGLRELKISSFDIKTSPEGRRYIIMTHKETTKKSQGDETMNSKSKDNSNNLIVEQPGNPRCPVATSEKYLSKIDKNLDVLFQQPKKNVHPKYKQIWYHKKVVGKETTAT